jgi:hypothetical protein
MQARTCSFYYRDTKGLSERSIQKDGALLKNLNTVELSRMTKKTITTNSHGGHVTMRNRAKQSDPILQEVGFSHLEEIDHFRPIAA